jgi:hypothetical protein
LRAVPDVVVPTDEPDMTENRFWLLVKLMKELRDLEERSGSKVEFRGDAAPSANANGLDANGIGKDPDSRCCAIMFSRDTAGGGMRAFSGRMMVEFIIFLENPLL